MNSHLLFALFLGSSCAFGAPHSHAQDDGPSLTVYSSADPAGFDPQQFITQQRRGSAADFARQVPGFAVIREMRTIDIQKGMSEVRFTDVAAFIDPTTVGFRDMTAPGTKVLEQNFEFDLVSPTKLLSKYIDKPITIQASNGLPPWKGILLSASGSSAVLQMEDEIEIIPIENARISLTELPGGLITRPTLVWKLQAALGGEHVIQTNYQTAGITWRADYNLTLNKDDSKGDLTAWVSLMNLSGRTYENAQLKLVAGDVQRITPQKFAYREMAADVVMPPTGRLGAQAFEEQSFFEYHLYTLPRMTTVRNNGTQQIALFPPVQGFKVTKELLYLGAPQFTYGLRNQSPATNAGYGNQSQTDVGVFIAFENKKDNGLGMPIPAGKVRVYKENPNDGALEFLGEDLVKHTPRNEEIRIKVGNAFDVVGERTQDSFAIDKNGKTMTETYTIEIRNQKDEAQRIVIREPLYRWTNWKITETTAQFKKLNAQTIEWTVDVPAEGTQKINYTVRYTW